ncbi:MAG: hypothetical protein COB07_11735 [Sulfurovum sp.]|nr:MAG: hypothetical protein COB07_11735 [Sulfurovum sp.]
MYKRIEDIENEKLEWDQGTEPSKKVKVVMPSGSKKQRSSQKFPLKTNVKDLSKRDVALFSMAATLLFPYMLGLMLTYFLFSFYGGMSLLAFLNIDKDYLFIQLWGLGAYFFITTWVIWAILRTFRNKRSYISLTVPIPL